MAQPKWERVVDVKAFLESRGQKTSGPHAFNKLVLHWPVCSRCGLLALRNDTTRREIKRPCVVEE